jgi:hypothetical protein
MRWTGISSGRQAAPIQKEAFQPNRHMRTLIYKRTHRGDPNVDGQFGIYDCMGQVRAWSFDAVIGVGGMGAEPRSHGLDGKVNWIGIGPHKRASAGKRGPIVTFDHFWFRGADGPNFEKLAPQLAHRIYSRNVRVLMHGLSAAEQREVDSLLKLAKDAPPSAGRTPSEKSPKGCSR